MNTDVLFHGTTGDNILSILRTGAILPGADGKIFFGRYRWDSCLMHGADASRRDSFVVTLKAHIPERAIRHYQATQGVADTLVVETTTPIHVEVLELHVRTAGPDFAFEHIVGRQHIEARLTRR